MVGDAPLFVGALPAITRPPQSPGCGLSEPEVITTGESADPSTNILAPCSTAI